MYLSSFSFKLLTNTYLLINPFLLSTSIVHPAAIDESRYPTDQPNEFVWSQFLPPIIVGETSTIPYQHAILPRVTPKSEAPTDFQPIKASSTTTCCSSGHSQNRRSVSSSGSGVNSFISTYIDVAKCIVSCLLLLFAIFPFASAQEGNDDSSFSMQDVTCLATAGLAVCMGLVGSGRKYRRPPFMGSQYQDAHWMTVLRNISRRRQLMISHVRMKNATRWNASHQRSWSSIIGRQYL